MKIGFDTAPATFPETYFRHLAKLLAKYAPDHEYIIDRKRGVRVDIYHGFRYPAAIGMHLRGARSVVTIPNLNFLHYPQVYPRFDRWIRIRLYKYVCRKADCVIALNRRVKEELAEKLEIDDRKIKVMMPLSVHPPVENSTAEQVDRIRRKYGLSKDFVLMVGLVEPRHNQLEVIEAMINVNTDINLIICGRHTSYSDFLQRFSRSVGEATEVEFIYEADPADMPAVFRMSRAFVYLPDADAQASVLPVVEALRAEVPMVLSDTPQHREVAGDAALYVPQGDLHRLTMALECVLCDEELREELKVRERVRAELYSEYAVAQRLIELYTSL